MNNINNLQIKRLSIIGSTGSIGTQALEVAEFQNDIKITALSANTDYKKLAAQANRFKPHIVCIMKDELKCELENLLTYDTEVVTGIDGLCKIAEYNDYDMLLTSVVGNIGLLPTVKAIECGKKILLANKETLVTGGEIIMPLARKNNVDIIPVDSEHSAIFQSLRGNYYKDIKKIILTASGGPFFGKTRKQLESIKKGDALKHPNWSMGSKITIDSATMMNKGLEVIEAKWLFNVELSDIEVVVHRQSIVHSAVEYCDNSIIAQMGVPDMKLPISYAVNYPDRVESPVKELNLFDAGMLTFEKPDIETFKCLKLAKSALKYGSTMPAVLNAANEVAVESFLNDEISFLDIAETVEKAMNEHLSVLKSERLTVDKILEADKWARKYTKMLVSVGKRN